jgi:molybdenum cofactor biosynthesis protein B
MAHDGHEHHHDHHHHHHEHHHGESATAVATWVLSCSDVAPKSADESGELARRLISQAGHTVAGYERVGHETAAITHAVHHALEHGARCLVVTGGTGLSRRDVTLEAIEPLFDKRIDGFGELFRMVSFQQGDHSAWWSRAAAGQVHGALVFVLPGSPAAVTLALQTIILPQLEHAVRELVR